MGSRALGAAAVWLPYYPLATRSTLEASRTVLRRTRWYDTYAVFHLRHGSGNEHH